MKGKKIAINVDLRLSRTTAIELILLNNYNIISLK